MRTREKEILADPYKKIRTNTNRTILYDYKKNIGFGEINEIVNEEKIFKAYTTCLSTFSQTRGKDFSDVDNIFYDEIIPEVNAVPFRKQGIAFMNAYETINRNRELEGKEPVKVIFCGNAINLNNSLLMELGISGIIARMYKKKLLRYTDKKRSIYIELMEDSLYINAKKETSLYKLTRGTDFESEALYNNFVNDNFDLVKKIDKRNYTPVIEFDKYTIYIEKNSGAVHIEQCTGIAKEKYSYTYRDALRVKFSPRYRLAKINCCLTVDDYSTYLYFESVMSRK